MWLPFTPRAYRCPATGQLLWICRPQQQQAGRQGGRGRGQGQQSGGSSRHQSSWQEIVKQDHSAERPPWLFSCYAHERGGQNDLLGDTSFEELRWQQLQVPPPFFPIRSCTCQSGQLSLPNLAISYLSTEDVIFNSRSFD